MIAWEEERYQRKATYGVPVLYPTPNRSEELKIQPLEGSMMPGCMVW